MMGIILGIMFCMTFFLAAFGYANIPSWIAIPIVFFVALLTLIKFEKE